MPINPIQFANRVNEQFLNYQLTAFPLTDPDLARQAREQLKGGHGQSPLLNGPYVSLSKSYRRGEDLRDLAEEGLVHPVLPGLTEYPRLFQHQWETLKAVKDGKHCLIATGTGSGKTEAFLYPILEECLQMRDDGAPEGVMAVLVYPMNALAHDQLERLREMLAGSGISFGMYVGPTPSDKGDVTRQLHEMEEGEDTEDYRRYARQFEDEGVDATISPFEERLTERQMAENPPRILLTNVHQLELLLTRGKDLGMFVDAPLRYLVTDEAHTYTGVRGAEVACLIRRLRAFCGKSADEVTCIGTSATVTDLQRDEEAAGDAADFAHRFFGINPDDVTLVKEEYEDEEFADDLYTPPGPEENTCGLLQDVLEVLDRSDERAVREVVPRLTGRSLSTRKSWPQALYDRFKSNGYVRALYHHLNRPCHLHEATQRIFSQIGREWDHVGEQERAELLCYLVLGAAAENQGNPLIRPQVHYFVKGMQGGAVAFTEQEEDGYRPDLSLSMSEAVEKNDVPPEACLSVLVCKTCGQHYYEGYYDNFELDDLQPRGGTAEGNNAIWRPTDEAGGNRVLLTDRFLSEQEDRTRENLDEKRFEIYFCRYCGTLHLHPGECQKPRCGRGGSLVKLWGVKLEDDNLKSCLSCRHGGGRVGGQVREPIRPLRAITVADVHILAQNMLNATSSDRRNLIVFSDNRQDAAFQAGWMKDHARRYRMRHLIYDYLRDQNEPVGIRDVQEYLYREFEKDRNLARSLMPEIYEDQAHEYFGKSHRETLLYALRIILVRELATSWKQRDSLENWGVMRVEYAGVCESNEWIQNQAGKLGLEPGELADGIALLLDSYRRGNLFYDPEAPIFSRWWSKGDSEVQQGFLPLFDFPPPGMKKYRLADDNKTYVRGFLSKRGQTAAKNYVSKWGAREDRTAEFLDELWDFLAAGDEPLLPTVTLKGSSGKPVSGASGVRQVDSTRVGLIRQYERYRCGVCQRIHPRPSPNMACTGYRCDGKLSREEPPEDDYNLSMLEMPFRMVQAEEHSGQVPGDVREELEDQFKQPDGRVNCLVSTPTLELGVDIGDLDMILMRNVPPKPSNYWQRAGRAGRRHRMAVIYTYVRRSTHDRYFFEDPARMLDGRIETPQFNLRNEVMVRKHVHAAVISELIRMFRLDPDRVGLSPDQQQELKETYDETFPTFISAYLFEQGTRYRDEPYRADRLGSVISTHRETLLDAVDEAFQTYWPEHDRPVVHRDALDTYIREMADQLQKILDRMHRRLMWAVQTQKKLLQKEQKGFLSSPERSLRYRCRRYIERLNQRNLRNYTLSALAAEGFLPGYGLYEQGVRAFASGSMGGMQGREEFRLDRPSSIALRELVPGNMIYANNSRFRVNLYHLPVGQRRARPVEYLVDLDRERVEEVDGDGSGEGYGDVQERTISAIPICDLDISYFSRISDQEDYRFQMPVNIMGQLKEGHRGIRAYSVAGREVQHRFGQFTRLINVGATDLVREGELGYPVCEVCGATRSPYASEKDRQNFREIHRDKHDPDLFRLAFYADQWLDGLLFQGLDDKAEGMNLGEALRLGASRLLEMDVEDLQILLLPQGDGSYHTFLYDPMPGGSGLLQQMIDRWEEVVSAARKALSDCPGQCESSCYECLRTYRNAFFHELLDRFKALDVLSEFDGKPSFEREDPPLKDFHESEKGGPTNRGEKALGEMLQQAGFPDFDDQQTIEIGSPFGSTTPDLYYEDPSGKPCIAVYLDGLSAKIHGNEDAQRRDRMIRQQLEARGVNVIEIARSDLDDPEAMQLHYRRIAHKLDLEMEENDYGQS